MLKKIIPIITILSLCSLIVLLNVTNPVLAGPFGILAIFIFSYLLSLGVITYFLYWASRVIRHLSIFFILKKPLPELSFKRAYYYSTILAAAPIMLIGLQSVGSVGLYEFILVAIFVIIGCLYISKRSH